MSPCSRTCVLLLLCTVSVVRVDNVPPVDVEVIVEDSTVSPLEETTPTEVNKTQELSVNNNEVIMLDDKNVNYVSENFNFVLILFYVKWCRFSVAMLPTFDQLVIELNKVVPNKSFAITKFDCDIYDAICDNYGIVKFPTVKVMRHGSLEKLEYRKERTVEALVNYVKEELVDPTIVVEAEDEALKVETERRRIIGYLSKRRPYEEENFRRAATHFKNLCAFIMHLSDSDDPPRVLFQPDAKSPEDESAQMHLNTTMTFPYLRDWANYKCVPYVREITFENAEEITEEGLPLFIFFYSTEKDLKLMKTFKRVITKHFVDDVIGRKINFLTANGAIFEHPLAHLGKTMSDLPVIAIDSLKHMFSYPHKSEEDLVNLEKLKRYLADFYSNRLHMKFHGMLHDDDHREDDEPKASIVAPHHNSNPQELTTVAPRYQDGKAADEDEPSIIKDSDFIRLYPSEKRYTLKRPIRDEL